MGFVGDVHELSDVLGYQQVEAFLCFGRLYEYGQC